MNKLYILKFIIISIVLIFIILNLYHICSNKFKEDEDTYEKYVDDAERERLGSLSERNRDVSQNITDTLNNIQDTANNTSIYSQLDNLKNTAFKLYNEILGDSNKCRNAYDDKLGIIAAGYDVQRNLKCTDNATDIATGNAVGKSFEECANICSNDKNCSSFSFDFTNGEIKEGRCRLSSSCHKDNLTTEQDANSNVYVRKKYDKIFNYKGLKNKVCNSVCFQDGDKSSDPTETIEKCAENCYYDSGCIAFEYEFPENKNEDGMCTIRTKCNENTHVKDYDTYTCFYDEMNSNSYRNEIYDNTQLINMSINSTNEHSLIDLYKNKCKEECDKDDGKYGRDNCKGFNLVINDEIKQVDCKLYNNLSYDETSNRIEVCKKPLNRRKKQLYSKVVDGTIENRGQGECDGLCESLVTDEIGYVKFFKESNESKYSHIIFTNTYNIISNTSFNLSQYKFIEVKFGWKAIFKDTNDITIHNYQNPSDSGLQSLTSNIKLDYEYDIFTRISIQNIDTSIINTIELVKLDDECFVRYSLNDNFGSDSFNNLKEKCNFNPNIAYEKVCYPIKYLSQNPTTSQVSLECNDAMPGSDTYSAGIDLSGNPITLSYNDIKNKPYCNSLNVKVSPNALIIGSSCGSGDNVMLKSYLPYPNIDEEGACILDNPDLFNFNYSSNIQTFRIPKIGRYRITAIGANGGNSDSGGSGVGGKGAIISIEKNIINFIELKMLVGGKGADGEGGGGGGGTFISSDNIILLIAGGGGGCACGGCVGGVGCACGGGCTGCGTGAGCNAGSSGE